MTFSRFLLSLLCSLASIGASADSVSLVNRLISQGNRAYELNQRARILECADSASRIIVAGKMHPGDSIDLSASVAKLYGNYYYVSSDTVSARRHYLRALAIMDANPTVSFGMETRMLLFRDLAQLHYLGKDYSLAAHYLDMADDIMDANGLYLVGSDRWLITRLTYAITLARLEKFDQAIDMAKKELDRARDKNGLEYARAERMYAKILMLADADRSGALKAYRDFFAAQKRFALDNFSRMDGRQRADYWLSLRPFIADCYQLEDADPAFLYDVTLFAKGLLLQLSRLSGDDVPSADAIRSLSYRWSDIQKRLKPRSAAIEFIQYEKDGSQRMAALLLKPAGKPRFISLTSPDSLLLSYGRRIRSTDPAIKDALYADTILHDKVWTPALLSALGGTSRLYFAPDGYLHRLAIEYMPPVASLDLYRLSSTRRLMEPPAKLAASASTLLFGGVNYDRANAQVDSVVNDAAAYAYYTGKYFPSLSEASNEAKAIYLSRANPADSLVQASYASEGTFRDVASAYESILVSSHGDFCGDAPLSSDVKPIGEDNYLSQNIIAFAGVNSHLRDSAFDSDTRYDGLLSASEISSLDLSRCKLFTVSACQSALGEISADGVYGLQRGLKNAGVDAMLLSLWNVNSDATAALMRSFYSGLADGKAISRAFADARAGLLAPVDADEEPVTVFVYKPAIMASRRVTKSVTPRYDSPKYANAFILIDAID